MAGPDMREALDVGEPRLKLGQDLEHTIALVFRAKTLGNLACVLVGTTPKSNRPRGEHRIAYYDEALTHNTPYEAPGFGFQQISAIVRGELIANPHPFDKVFLSVPHETIPVIQVCP